MASIRVRLSYTTLRYVLLLTFLSQLTLKTSNSEIAPSSKRDILRVPKVTHWQAGGFSGSGLIFQPRP